MQQRRLARARRADDRHQLARRRRVKLTPRSAGTGGSAPYVLVTSSSSSTARDSVIVAGTTTRWPAAQAGTAHLHEPVGVVEEPERDRDQMVRRRAGRPTSTA